MKHYSIILIILIWIGCAKAKSECPSFPKKNIKPDKYIVDESLRYGKDPIATYINNLDKEEQFVLHCYESKYGTKVSNRALIRTIDFTSAILIYDIPCSNRISLTESTYMHLKTAKHNLRKHKFLAFGILTDTREWCRYDIGLDVEVVKYKTYNKPEMEQLWNWSEPGIQLSRKFEKEYSLEAKNGLAADYVSDGSRKYVLNCYHDGTAILRSPMGHRIAELKDACTTNQVFIQTFYVYTALKEIGVHKQPATGSVYTLIKGIDDNAEQQKAKKFRDRRDFSWYDGSRISNTMDRYWLLPFTTAIGGGRNCYWNKVDVDIPNTCPSLPDESMILLRQEFKQIYKDYKLSAVAKYISSHDKRLILTCWKGETDKVIKYYSAVTTVNGYFLISLNNLDCLRKDNFNHMLTIQFTYDEQSDENNPNHYWKSENKELNEKMEKKRKQEQEKRQYEFFTVSTRSSIDEEWCSYSVQKIFETEFSTSSSVYKWVYYTHKPTGLWIEYQNQCDGFAGRIIAGAYKLSASYEDFSPLRYIWVAPDQSDVLLLHCHRDKDPLTGKEFYIGIIKTLQNEYLFSIVGLECWTSLNPNEHHYMRLTAIDQHKYVSIGLRESEEKEWCRYDLCVDCKDIIPKLQMEGYSFGKLIIWSQAAVEWKRGNTEDYEYNKKKINYKMISNGKTQFILMCRKTRLEELIEESRVEGQTRGKNKETIRIENQKKVFSKNGNVLMSASGAFMANVDFVCNYSNIFKWLLYFVTESIDGKLSLHTSRDCKRGCDVDVDKQRTIKESWLYYSAAENIEQYEPFKFYTIYQEAEKDCNNLKKEDIKTTVQTSMSAKLMSEYRTGKRFNIKISCYVVEEQNKLTYHADVTFKDNPLIRIEGLNCKKKEDVIDRLAVTIPGNEDTSQVVIGYKESAKKNWCSYNVMKIPDSGSYEIERYYGYVPDELTLQWYENNPNVNCPLLKKNNILVKKWENSDTELKNNEAKTYVGNLNDKYIMLHCIKKIVSNKEVYTSVFTSMDKEGDFSVTVEGLDCASKSDLQKFGIYFWNPADLEYIILETVIPEKHYLEVCRYDIELDMDKPQVYMNLRTTFETNIFLWSEAGIVLNSRPSFLEKLNPIDENHEVIGEANLIQVYYSKHFTLEFLTRCYKKDEKYFSVITSTRGYYFGTVPGYNCLEYWFHNVYIHFKIGDKLEFSGDLKAGKLPQVNSPKLERRHLCWYYSCHAPNEPSGRIEVFYFFKKYEDAEMINYATKRKVHESGMAKNVPGHVSSFGRKPHFNLFDTKRVLLYTISDWWPMEVLGESFDDCSSLKRDEIKQYEAIEDSKLSLVAKYVRKQSPKIELHCHMKVDKDKINYFYTIANVYGKPMFSVVDHDCSPNEEGEPMAQLFVAVDQEYQDDGKALFFVGNSNCWISVVHCPSCKTEVINTLNGHAPDDQYNWEQVSTSKTCPKFEPEDIYKNAAFPLEEDPFDLYTRYVNNYLENAVGQYVLLCYRSQDEDDDRGYVMMVKTLQGEYLVSIKGLDCSKGFNSLSPTYISLKRVEKKLILVAGSRTVVQQSTGPWCFYEACLNCGTLQVSQTASAPEESFQWSEAEIKIEKCPSRNRSAFNYDLNKSTVVEEYMDVIWQDCHKDPNGNWFLQLKTKTGIFIMAIPLKQSCDGENQNLLVREFYVHLSEDEKLVTMTSSNIEDLAETCWNSRHEKVLPDSWFYYFPKNKPSELYKKLGDPDTNCPLISSKSITMEKIEEENMKYALKVEYLNGGEPKVKLKFYQTKDDNEGGSKESYFATISSEDKDEVFKIEGLNFSDEKLSMLDRVIYAEYGEDNYLIVGSKEKQESEWCWFKLYYYNNEIEKILKIDHYQPKHGTSQWYKVENKDCSFFKWENVHTEENKELWSQVPESIEIGYLHLEDQTTKILKEVFVTYTYSEKEPNNLGAKVCTMVIRNDHGRHLARIEQIECSRSWTLYMFRYSEYQDHLIVGGVSASESDKVHSVCQYDICITCQEKNVRFNTHIPTDQEKTAIRWVKDHEKIAVNAPSRKNQHVKFDDERLKISYISEKTPLFYIECHMTGSAIYSKNYGVLRTYTGLIIGTIKEKNCDSVNSVNEIHLRYLVTKTGDGYILVHDLNITDPPDYETGSCWFYGCSTSPINEILVFYDVVPRPQQSQPSIWARVTVLPSKPCPNIDSSSSFLKKPKNEESSVVTKFVDSKNYKLECYFNSNDLEYTAVIYDSQGNYIITLVDYDCSSIKNLQNKVEIVTEENKSDVDVNFIFISPFTSCGISSYTLCPDCEKEKELIIFKPNLKVNSEWTQVSTDQCHTSSEQTIITDAGLIDLNGYKVNKIYINEDETDENVFILRCLGKQGSEDVYTRLDSLDGQHIFYLRNADCITLEKLTTRMYIAIARIKEHRYLAVGTRTDVKGTFSPWCRYDICLNCEKVDKHVHYNFESDPFNLLTFKWSMSSLETELQSGFDATRMQYVTKNVHRKHTEYSTECYFDPARNMKRTAIKLNMKPLLAVYDHECITRNFLFRTFYIYTSYKDSKYSLFRMGQEKEAKPELLENEIEKLFFWFIEKDAPEERPWRQVGNPKVETQDKDVEDLMCTPRAKTINDLSYKVFRAKDGDDDGD